MNVVCLLLVLTPWFGAAQQLFLRLLRHVEGSEPSFWKMLGLWRVLEVVMSIASV